MKISDSWEKSAVRKFLKFYFGLKHPKITSQEAGWGFKCPCHQVNVFFYFRKMSFYFRTALLFSGIVLLFFRSDALYSRSVFLFLKKAQLFSRICLYFSQILASMIANEYENIVFVHLEWLKSQFFWKGEREGGSQLRNPRRKWEVERLK